jgi:dolichyl-phosphate-mannose--protein O-mannosyl transferase
MGWLGPLSVGVAAALLRLINLGRPDKIVFDETYYAKDALSLLRFGYERKTVEGANDLILAGDTDVFIDEASYIVHPPLGKWLVALGIRLFGMEPVGWRIASALAGVITVIIVARVGRRLFRSTMLGSAAGLFVAVDGMAITISRIAILDGILAMFIIAGFASLLVDRDRTRERYADWIAARLAADLPLGDGPSLGWRPWRLAAGVLLGCAAATKWSGLFALAVFGVLTVLWDISMRRAGGTRSPTVNALLRDGPVAFVTMVIPAITVYLASWSGWIASDNAWDRQWGANHEPSAIGGLMPDWLRGLWHYHSRMLGFHGDLTDGHTYESGAWSWLIMQRPVSFDWESFQAGENGCNFEGVDECSQAMLALGNPILWWAGVAALLVCLWQWFVRRDWRGGAIVAGVLATWAPWLFITRTTFAFYAVAIGPFVALAVAYALGLVIGDSRATPTRRAVGVTLAGAFVLAVLVVAWFFYPIHVDELIPRDEWGRRMWLDSWI